MDKSIFVTGTGTDIGKTYICALIAKTLKDNGYNCGYYKPVLSGAIQENGKLIAGDCEFVIRTANLQQEAINSVSYIFKNPVSPHLAANIANIEIDKNKILSDACSKTFEYLIIEGAGGITCPLTLTPTPYLMSDLIKDLKTNIIIVADAGLGTINNTLLTVEYAKSHSIKTIGIILNNYIYNNAMYEDNIKTIEALCNTKVIGLVEKNGKTINTLNYKLIDIFEDKNELV